MPADTPALGAFVRDPADESTPAIATLLDLLRDHGPHESDFKLALRKAADAAGCCELDWVNVEGPIVIERCPPPYGVVTARFAFSVSVVETDEPGDVIQRIAGEAEQLMKALVASRVAAVARRRAGEG